MADLSAEELNTIAQEAYAYSDPLVTMDVSRRQFTNIEGGKMTGRGPMNTFSNVRDPRRPLGTAAGAKG